VESIPYAWLRCRARAAARRAFHEHFDPVGGLLEDPFAAAVDAIVEVCERGATAAWADDGEEDRDGLPLGVVESVVIPIVDRPEIRDRLAGRAVGPPPAGVAEHTTGWTDPPPIHAFVDDPTGPIREENLFVSPSGAWRAIHSFVHDGTVHLVWFGDACVDEHRYHAAYRITDPPDVAQRWFERARRWVDAEDLDDEEWPEDWWPEVS
jgi:hypothetical protein